MKKDKLNQFCQLKYPTIHRSYLNNQVAQSNFSTNNSNKSISITKHSITFNTNMMNINIIKTISVAREKLSLKKTHICSQ